MVIPKFKPNKRQRKYNDLSGQKFSKLLVLYRTDNYVTNGGKSHTQYACRCECGVECVVRATNLKSGKTESCGCIRKGPKPGTGFEDLTGQSFHRWTALYRTDSIVEPSGQKATMWQCRCECGVERAIRSATLKSGLSKSCGCLKMDVLGKIRHLEGEVFGRWLVLEKAPDSVTPKGRYMKRWLCRCDCGTERIVGEQSLVRGKSVSCGCYRKEQLRKKAQYEDLTGNIYGQWSVLERVPDRFYPGGGRATMWRCRCICNTESVVAGNMLKSSISQSCGCTYTAESKTEKHVSDYLDEKGVHYTKQKRYDGLVGVGGRLLSYDFLLYVDDTPVCLIEYQGLHHFEPVEYFGGVEKFKIQQQHDILKRNYAQSLGLPLIEIHYKHQSYKAIASQLDAQLNSII